MQSPGKLPGNIKIKHISAITHQNSTNLKLYLFRQSLKSKEKNHFLCSFLAIYMSSVKSSKTQPLLLRIQSNLKVNFPFAKASITMQCSFPANYLVLSKPIIAQPFLVRKILKPFLIKPKQSSPTC